MNNIQALTLNDIVYFKGTTRFVFEPGLTFIQGRNLQRRGPNASNGSGKSLLFGTLPNLLFDTHPTVTKNVRSVQRQIYGKGSSAAVDFVRGKHAYVYTKAGSKTELTRDGQNLKSRIARDQLRSLIDLSEEEFFSTVYLDSRRNNNFQLGTSADRFAFITELFRLQDIDDLRKHANKCISDLNSDGRLLEQTKADLASARTEFKALPADAQERADELATWIKKASVRAQRLAGLHHQWENYSRWLVENEKLEALTAPKHTTKQIRTHLSELDGYEAELRQWRKQEKQRGELQAELDALKLDDSAYDTMLKRKNRLTEVDEPEEPKGDLSVANRLAKKASLDRAETILSKARAKSAMLKEELATFNSEVGEADQCPTCHSDLSEKTKAAIRKSFETQIEDLARNSASAKACIDAHKFVKLHDQYVKDKQAYEAYRKELRELRNYPFKEVKRQLELKTLLSAKTLAKPKPPTTLIFGNDRDKLEAELKRIQQWEEQKRLVDTLQTEKPDEAVDANALKKLNAEVSTKMGMLPDMQAKASDRKTLLKTIRELKTRVDEMEQKLADLPVYQMLAEAYSTKGIKMLMVQRIAKGLEKNLNRYARQIFSEDFKFSFNVVDGKFDVNVTRRHGKKENTSDIRHMSGAESRLFVFLFVLALLPLIPDRRRMNILVLDEPDANMDVETREIFRDSLLPRLAKIVPSLIVISPNSDVVPQHARVFTVVKDKGASKLVKGFVK
jgi:DNA repair exonuclease SbcCD ATPase subunit